MQHNSPAISIRNLRKTYPAIGNAPAKEALKSITLDIPQGAFFGFLGPNGAGKSTLINIIAGLVMKSSGNVEICGHDIERAMRQARMSLGVVPQELILDTFFTVRQALEIHAGYYGIPSAKRRTQEIIDAMGLSDKADVHSRRLSGGMRRRLLIAKALVHSPKVLILDEPTAGVDVELRTHLWEYVSELNRQGTTVLLTTHYLEEAEALCDSIAIINHGEIIAHDSTRALLSGFDSKQLNIRLTSPLTQELPADMANQGWQLQPDHLSLTLRYRPSQTSVHTLLTVLQQSKLEIADISTAEAGLEEVFLHLTRSDAQRHAS
jgi:ABC-2 type transport system ATP-binding protein